VTARPTELGLPPCRVIELLGVARQLAPVGRLEHETVMLEAKRGCGYRATV